MTSLYKIVIVLYLLLHSRAIAAAKKKKKKKVTLTKSLLSMCGANRPIKDHKRLTWLLQWSGEGSLLLPTSAQHQAACWLLQTDRRVGSKRRTAQRYALATLHFATTHSNTTRWEWKMAADLPKAAQNNKWMSVKHHECQWYGVQCSTFPRRITGLDLGFLSLDGLLPRELQLLSDLQDLDLHGNDLQGVLPYVVLNSLHKLQYLQLQENGFFGALPPEIVGLKSLRELHIFGNYLGGSIPTELGKLKGLTTLDFYANQLGGRIPTQLGQLKKLKSLDAHDNNLTGSVPQEICNLKLKELIVDCLGPTPEVQCDCCTVCCRGLPDFKCVDMATGQEILPTKYKP